MKKPLLIIEIILFLTSSATALFAIQIARSANLVVPGNYALLLASVMGIGFVLQELLQKRKSELKSYWIVVRRTCFFIALVLLPLVLIFVKAGLE